MINNLNNDELKEKYSKGRTTIHFVCAMGKPELLKILINRGVSQMKLIIRVEQQHFMYMLDVQ